MGPSGVPVICPLPMLPTTHGLPFLGFPATSIYECWYSVPDRYRYSATTLGVYSRLEMTCANK